LGSANSHNVLVIGNKPPYPSIDGGCFAMGKFEQLLRPLVSKFIYFAIETPKHPFKAAALPLYWKLNENFFTHFIDTAINSKHVAKYLEGSSIRAARFYTKATEIKLLELIGKYQIDTVIFESVYSAVYLKGIKKKTNARCYIRTHNIEYQIWEKHYEDMSKGLKKIAFKNETERLRKFEVQCLSHSDGNIFISEKDELYSRKNITAKRSATVPVQIEITGSSESKSKGALKLFHIGAMDWKPNIEGVKRFLEEIYPTLQNKFPGLELHLAGKSMPDEFNKYASQNVTIHGEVKDADEFIKSYDVSIVPLLSGSGIRIKILEAMAHGKPVITTAAGIHGIPATAGENYLQAGTMEDWIAAIRKLNDPDFYKTISGNGINFIRENYSVSILQPILTEFINQ